MDKTVSQATSGSLLLNVVLENLNLSLEQFCNLSCVSATTAQVLRGALKRQSITYSVALKDGGFIKAESLVAW
jgi:hypothetical protein